MAMEMARLNELAEQLRRAQRTGEPCKPLRQQAPELTIEDAYAIQKLNIDLAVGLGAPGQGTARVVGWKIGVTSEAVQTWLGVHEPDFGCLLDTMTVDDGDAVSMAGLLQPRAEGELAFVLSRPLKGPGVTAVDVMNATACVLPAIEIIDSRIEGWDIKIVDTVADNASSARFAVGSRPIPLAEIDVRLIGMALRKNGVVAATGAGAASLGNPLKAVAWLANRLGALGEELKAGDVVLAGALGPVVEVAAGDWLEVQVGSRDRVSVRFVA